MSLNIFTPLLFIEFEMKTCKIMLFTMEKSWKQKMGYGCYASGESNCELVLLT